MKKSIIAFLAVAAVSSFCAITVFSPNGSHVLAEITEETTPIITVTYNSMGVPNINSSFKTYMDYRTITDRTSPQYDFVRTWGWTDGEGFLRANGERDLGISDDYYMIALGSYYGTEIGTKYKITTDAGNVFYGVLCDQKDDSHTNSTHQYAYNNDIIEFVVDTRCLRNDVRKMGSANVYMPLNGSITSIERIDFIRNGG